MSKLCDIAKLVELQTEVTLIELKGGSKFTSIVYARTLFTNIANIVTLKSTAELGVFLNKKPNSIYKMINRAENIKVNPNQNRIFAKDCNEILLKLKL